MLIHDGGGGDGPTMDPQDYARLSVTELLKALEVDRTAIGTAIDQWGNLHQCLDEFLGTTTPSPDTFPALVATLKDWHSKAADEFRSHADDITKLATDMMTRAGAEHDTVAATYHLVTSNVLDTLASAQDKVLTPLKDGWQKWKHVVRLMADIRYLGSNQAFYILVENGQPQPTHNAVSTPEGDTIDVYPMQGRNTADGPVVEFVYSCQTNRHSAYEPYAMFGRVEVHYFPGTDYTFSSIRGYGPIQLTAWNPVTGQDRPGEVYTAPDAEHVNPGALMDTFDSNDHSAYKDQLVTLANAVGYLYQYRMKQLPDLAKAPTPDTGNNTNGPGPGLPPLGPSPFDHNGLLSHDSFNPASTGPPLLPLSDLTGPDGQLAGLGRDPNGLFTPGAGSGLGLDGLSGPGIGAGGLGAGGGLGVTGPGGGLFGPGAGGTGVSGVDGGLATAGAAGLGRGMLPMAPGAGMAPGQGGRDRSRQSWLTEDESIWGADSDDPGPVL
jgi:hypothetical protein